MDLAKRRDLTGGNFGKPKTIDRLNQFGREKKIN